MEETNWIQEHWRLVVEMLIIAIATVFLAVLVRRVGDRAIKRLSQKGDFDPTNFRFFQHSLTAVIIILGISLIIFLIPGLRHVATTMFAGAGILAVIVGFASQAALSNIVSGIFIVIFKPYRINDIITVKDSLMGVVEDISLRHTVIRNFENRRIVIPNSVISNEVVVNANIVEEKICKFIDFGISYTANIERAREIVQELVEAHPNFMDVRSEEDKANNVPAVPVRVIRLGEYSINMRAWAWAANQGNGFLMGCDIYESIKKRFDAEGIEIPFPYRNLIIKDSNSQTLESDKTVL